MEERDLLQRELARERAARKEAERLLEHKSRELYDRNQALEAEVAERRRIEASLREHSTALARSNAELEQFAYVASHDLQAPLRGIVSFSQLLARRLKAQLGESLDGDCRDYLQFIDEGARRLRDVINDLLEFSRAGSATAELEPLPLQQALQQALTELEPVLRSMRAEVQVGALPRVCGDATQLAQLLRNLIDNAIKYVAAGVQPRIRIDATTRGPWAEVRVADNGIGIPEEHRARVFQIFQRLHGAETYPGTGVGLAICKKVVDRHGGELWVEPAVGGGSTFCFTLPLAAPEPGDGSEAALQQL